MSARSSLFAVAALSSALLAAAPASAASFNASVTIRDFCGNPAAGNLSACPSGFTGHPDFERVIADDRNIVQTTLGVDGKPVYALPGASTTVTSPERFNQFFNDTPGVNQSTTKSLTFNSIAGGLYQYTSNSFFPIDGELLGNQGLNHNFHFTLEWNGLFTYDTSLAKILTFQGDDDIWVFINKKLVIDLGGVHGTQTASVDLSTLGLTNGNDYAIDVFFAERHTTQSTLEITTPVLIRDVTEVPEPSTYALMLAGLGMLGFMARRRMNA